MSGACIFPKWPEKLVRKNFTLLRERCREDVLRPNLYEVGLLSKRDHSTMSRMEKQFKPNEDIMEWLFLEVLMYKGPGAFDKFVELLSTIDESHESILVELTVPDEFRVQMDELVARLASRGSRETAGGGTAVEEEAEEARPRPTFSSVREQTDPNHKRTS